VQGELERLCERVPGVRVTSGGYESSNWHVVIEKLEESRPPL
jgi:hypothetical protein